MRPRSAHPVRGKAAVHSGAETSIRCTIESNPASAGFFLRGRPSRMASHASPIESRRPHARAGMPPGRRRAGSRLRYDRRSGDDRQCPRWDSRGQPAHGGRPEPRPVPASQGTLLFLGIRPGMRVLQVWPEPGWYTEIIAPLLQAKGRYIARGDRAGSGQPFPTRCVSPTIAGSSPPGRIYTVASNT